LEKSSPTVRIHEGHDEIRGTYIYKQMQLDSGDDERLRACYASVHSLKKILGSDKEEDIKPRARELVWPNSNSNVVNNRLDLTIGIPANLYIARVNKKTKKAELIGVNKYYTKLNEGTYKLSIRLDGDNFLHQIFYVTFFYDGDKSIEFTEYQRKTGSIYFASVNMGITSSMTVNATAIGKGRVQVWLTKLRNLNQKKKKDKVLTKEVSCVKYIVTKQDAILYSKGISLVIN